MNSIQILMPPPPNAIDPPGVKVWSDVEGFLGVSLPSAYKEFLNVYGSGCINEFIWIFNPASKNKNIELLYQIRIRLDALRDLKFQGECLPYNLYPEVDGAIPFAATDNGDLLFFKPVAKSSYFIVFNEARSPVCEEVNLTWSNFIVHLVSGKINSKILPLNLFKGVSKFRSVG